MHTAAKQTCNSNMPGVSQVVHRRWEQAKAASLVKKNHLPHQAFPLEVCLLQPLLNKRNAINSSSSGLMLICAVQKKAMNSQYKNNMHINTSSIPGEKNSQEAIACLHKWFRNMNKLSMFFCARRPMQRDTKI